MRVLYNKFSDRVEPTASLVGYMLPTCTVYKLLGESFFVKPSVRIK